MAFRFRKHDRSVEQAVRRIAGEQVDKAINSIDDAEDPAVAVHDVRTRCKKLRGLLRLVRPLFEFYADENADFREIGRLLGEAREAAVLVDTYEHLAELYELVDRQARQRIPIAMQMREGDTGAAGRLKEVRERMMLARLRVDHWTLAADDWEAIGPGVMQTYLRARTALERIGAGHAPARFHELRKRVKYHWHHMRLLRPIDQGEIGLRIHLAAEVGDRLGEHHDLAMLESTLRRHSDILRSEQDVETVLEIARHHRVMLEERCLRGARQLLAESAESLTERLADEWDKWRD